jgi:hypothetical protein
MAMFFLVDDVPITLTDEEEAAGYWRQWTEEVWLTSSLLGSKANISAGAVEVFQPSFYQLNYLDEYATYTTQYLNSFPWDPSAGPLTDDLISGVYVASEAAYVALLNQQLGVAAQTVYVVMSNNKLGIAGQTAYVVLIKKSTKNYSQAMMGTF